MVSRCGWTLVTTTCRTCRSSQNVCDQRAVADPHRHHHDVAHATSGDLRDEIERVVDRRVGCASRRTRLAFSRLNSTGSIADDVPGAGQPGALHGVGTDAADADDGNGVAGLHATRRTPPNPTR